MSPRTVPVHPGTITFVDGHTDRVVSTEDASTLPNAVRFANTRKGLVPVVRVVAFVQDDRRFIREYGPKGELLRATEQRREGGAA